MKLRNFRLYAFCFLLLSFAPIASQAQGWDMTFGDPGLSEFIEASVELPDSSLVFFGYTRLWGTVDYTYFLSKVDQAGNLLWYRDYGGVFQGNYALDFDTLANGRFYLAGYDYDPVNILRGHRTIIVDEAGNVLSNNFSPFEIPMQNSAFVRRIKKDSNDEVWVLGTQLGNRLLFRKYGLQGELLSTYTDTELVHPSGTSYEEEPILTPDGGIVFLLKMTDEDENQNYRLAKALEEEVAWSTDFGYAHRVSPRAFVSTVDNGFLIWNERRFIIDTIASGQYQTVTKDYLTKIDHTGNISWEYALDSIGTSSESFSKPFLLPDGRIFVASQDNSHYHMYEFSPEGELLQETEASHSSLPVSSEGPKVLVTREGNRLLAFRNYDQNLLFYLIDDDDNLLWITETNLQGNETCDALQQTQDGSLLSYGYYLPSISGDSEALVMKLDSLGQINNHNLHGTLFFDLEENCSYDLEEIVLPNWIVNISGTPEKYAVTDTAGIYHTLVDDDSLAISVQLIGPYWQVCPDISPITFPPNTYSLNVDIPIEAAVDCPYMTVDVGTTLIRPCQSGTYYINYCNWGTVPADSAWVEVSFDANMQVDSASIAWDSQVGNTFIFSLGEVGVMQCGELEIAYTIACDSTLIGQTLCSEAHIYPDSLCLEPEPAYSGALVEVSAECQDSLVYFYLRNAGTAPTTGDLHYVVIEDAVLYMTQPFDLGVGEVLPIPFTANGSTYRLIAEQEPGALSSSQVSLAVEGCGTNENGNFSLGFINQFPNIDNDTYLDVDCREVVGAYDPNEKLAFPTGYGPQHLLASNQHLDYEILFQNTGNDTAFTVVLRDTLSQFLDPITVRPTNSSHPYRFDFATTADGKAVLEFVFDNILLPDSTTNERASHGFVKFRIDQRPDLPIGTLIENSAGIYFDINAVVMTNTVWHTISEQYIVVDLEDFALNNESLIQVAPNPVTNTALIQLEGEPTAQGIFHLYDLQGKLLRKQVFQNGIISFSRDGLLAGLYYFQLIKKDGKMLGQGKLVIQ